MSVEHDTPELWKDVVGYESLYQVSSAGRVRSVTRSVPGSRNGGRRIRQGIERKLTLTVCYMMVTLGRDGEERHCLVHRLVAEAFIPNPDGKPQVNHLNGIKTDNRVDNLEWATRSENSLHAYRTGLQTATGSANGQAVLTEADIPDIRTRLAAGESAASVAEDYGVHARTIRDANTRRTWSHVT